ncbi:hypothetical protein [Salinivibrio phage CW02]|uniref:Uncharacterized protein n=1 Tax=Salinivibrio phage CW02 TaxID=1161935 RepID=H9D1G1_9CAUD|nr:hypothetical protein F490_gp34 [Salinivibrio phage CW02]AFE86203.1 hypothetical protein [Salinivibrio phage CW02]
MAEEKSNKLGWFEAGIALILLVASGVGNYAAMSSSLATTEERVNSLREKIIANEEYDAYLTSQDEQLKERTIRNEEKIDTIQRNQKEFSNSVKELTKELRALRGVLIELKVKEEAKNG